MDKVKIKAQYGCDTFSLSSSGNIIKSNENLLYYAGNRLRLYSFNSNESKGEWDCDLL